MRTLHVPDYHLGESSSSNLYGWALRPFHLEGSDSQHRAGGNYHQPLSGNHNVSKKIAGGFWRKLIVQFLTDSMALRTYQPSRKV